MIQLGVYSAIYLIIWKGKQEKNYKNVIRIHLFLKELLVMFSKKLWPAWKKTTVATYWWGELVSFGLCCCYSVKFTQADLCLGKYLYSLIEKKFGLIYYETHDLFDFLEVPCSVLNMPTTHEYHFLSIRLNQHSLVHVSLKGKLATILYNIPRQYIDNSKTKTAECGTIWIGMKNRVVLLFC